MVRKTKWSSPVGSSPVRLPLSPVGLPLCPFRRTTAGGSHPSGALWFRLEIAAVLGVLAAPSPALLLFSRSAAILRAILPGPSIGSSSFNARAKPRSSDDKWGITRTSHSGTRSQKSARTALRRIEMIRATSPRYAGTLLHVATYAPPSCMAKRLPLHPVLRCLALYCTALPLSSPALYCTVPALSCPALYCTVPALPYTALHCTRAAVE